MKKIILIIAILSFTIASAYSIELPENINVSKNGQRLITNEVYEDSFYHIDSIRKIYIEFEDANWQTLLTQNYDDKVLIKGTLTMNGVQYPNVGVRYRGQTSYKKAPANKKSFKVEMMFDDDAEEQDLMGYTDIVLNNGFQDPSFMRDPLFARSNSVHSPTLKSNFVVLYCNGECWGLYNNVQQPNQSFIDQWFIGNDGARWRAEKPDSLDIGMMPPTKPPSGNDRFGAGTSTLNYLGQDLGEYYKAYTLKNESHEDDWEKLLLATEKLNKLHPSVLYDSLNKYIDVDQSLWFLANELIFADEDGYINKGGMDYYVYYDDENEQIVPFQYDANSTFSFKAARWTPFLKASDTTFALFYRIVRSKELRERYLAHYRTIVNNVFNSDRIDSLINYFDTNIKQLVNDDTHKIYSMTEYNNELLALKEFVAVRKEFLLNIPTISAAAPSISNVLASSDNGVFEAPNHDGTVEVTADVIFADGLDRVILYYSNYLSGQFKRLEMTNVSANSYKGEIPAMNAGTYVRWYIEAVGADAQLSAKYYPVGAEHDVFFYQVEASIASEKTVVINELMASNDETIADPQGEYDDWLELYNLTDEEINLTGYYITDKADNLTKFEFPVGSVIGANGYLLIWCDEDSSVNPDGLHTNFKLSSSGETALLVDRDGSTILDEVTYGEIESDAVYGRLPNGTGDFTYELQPTPNAENSNMSNIEYSTDIVANIFPNPTMGNAVLEFSLLESGLYQVELFDNTGRKHGNIAKGYFASGNNTLELDFKYKYGLSPGIYFIRIRNNNFIHTVSFIIK